MTRMNTMVRISLIAFMSLTLAGCGLFAGRPRPVSNHVLSVPAGIPAAAPAKPAVAVLLLGDTDATGIYQGLNLIYSRVPGALSQYQYARWSETPAHRLNRLLRERLDASGLYQAVAEVGAGVRGDYQLNTRLLDFYHDAALPPGVARVTLEAELVDRREAKLVARGRFQGEAPASGYDAMGAAAALGQASGAALDQLVNWLERVRPQDAR